MGPGIAPPFQEDFNRDLFRAGLVTDDPADNACNALVMCAKDLTKQLIVTKPHVG